MEQSNLPFSYTTTIEPSRGRTTITHMVYDDSSMSKGTIDDVIREDDAPATSSIPNPETDGVFDPSETVNTNSDGPPAGTPGHGGIDEGTE